MTTLAVIQARMGSTRLLGKVLLDLGGRPVLERVVTAARAVPGVDRVVVATGRAAADEAIADWCAEHGVTCHRGDDQDVLARIAAAAAAEGAAVIMRITADCPFLDPAVCGAVLMLRHRAGVDYASNVNPPGWPDGLDCEVFTAQALAQSDREARRASEREHVTLFMRNHPERFSSANLPCPLPGLGEERWTLDTPEDFEFLSALAAGLPASGAVPHLEVLRALEADPALRRMRPATRRNEAAARAMIVDAPNKRDFAASARALARAERVIPLGSQTFSKSRIQFPEGLAPLFLTHGEGGRVWDVDGNEYVDMVMGLLPVVLGYRDADVDRAIAAQLERGISFSLATTLEADLAERLVEIIPCAEQVRFGKNGTDATSAAVRLARAFTGRDRIAVGGYHGWQDWYVGATTRNKGVPRAVAALTHRFAYNDLGSLHALFSTHPGEFAAVMLEPMNVEEPHEGYLAELGEATRRAGALLVFDEVITGFRYALGGAQALFGITPDLASFGKAMANGMPISAVTGRADVMSEMEEIFFSSTFGGESLSLAAAIAVIDKMRREPVIETLWRRGAALAQGTEALIARHGLDNVIALTGKAPWKLLSVHDHPAARKEAIRTLLLARLIDRGVLISASHNIAYAHDEIDMEIVLAAYDTALGDVRQALDGGRLEAELPCPVIEPVFRVR